MSASVCVLSAAPLWVDPRARHAAAALHEAGYRVVVGYRAEGDVARDDALLAGAPWSWHRIDLARGRHPARWLAAALAQRAAECAVRAGMRAAGVDASAYCRGYGALLRWASAQDVDLFIAFAQPMLAVAAGAAARRGHAAYAFDCEDLLAHEAADGARAAWRRSLIERLERRHLRGAAYVSATSAPMAAHLVDAYALPRVHVIRNCFPAALRSGVHEPALRTRDGPLELAWVSATIGPGRGLEDLFAALGSPAASGQPIVLHLYGSLPARYQPWLDAQAARCTAVSMVRHGLVPEDELVLRLARHDVGLALDPDTPANRGLTVSNKLFLYLQAGLACVATSTPGHRSVLVDYADAAVSYAPGDAAGLAAALRRLTSRATLTAMQRAAWRAGSQCVWDVEREVLLAAVGAATASVATDRATWRAAS